MNNLGKEPQFIEGLRVTDQRDYGYCENGVSW